MHHRKDERCPPAKHAPHLLKRATVIPHVLQAAVRDDQVECLVREGAQVAQVGVVVAGRRRAVERDRPRNYGGGKVDGVHACASGGHLPGQPPCAAASVQHVSSADVAPEGGKERSGDVLLARVTEFGIVHPGVVRHVQSCWPPSALRTRVLPLARGGWLGAGPSPAGEHGGRWCGRGRLGRAPAWHGSRGAAHASRRACLTWGWRWSNGDAAPRYRRTHPAGPGAPAPRTNRPSRPGPRWAAPGLRARGPQQAGARRRSPAPQAALSAFSPAVTPRS